MLSQLLPKLPTRMGMSGRTKEKYISEEFLQTTIYSEGSNTPLDGSCNGKPEKKRTGVNRVTGTHKQYHISRDMRSLCK